LPSLLSALQQAEDERRRLEAAIAAVRQPVRFTPRTAKDVEQQVLEKLADWRGTLRADTKDARLVLKQLVTDRINFEPTEADGQRTYRYRGTFTNGRLFEGIVGAEMLASPTGPALMYSEDSIRVELAGGVVERAA
jgi:hypothetical protein